MTDHTAASNIHDDSKEFDLSALAARTRNDSQTAFLPLALLSLIALVPVFSGGDNFDLPNSNIGNTAWLLTPIVFFVTWIAARRSSAVRGVRVRSNPWGWTALGLIILMPLGLFIFVILPGVGPVFAGLALLIVGAALKQSLLQKVSIALIVEAVALFVFAFTSGNLFGSTLGTVVSVVLTAAVPITLIAGAVLSKKHG